jgi:hypothetical protein
VLDSPAYRTALANQTAWSKANIARCQNMIRAVARITISRGQGRGAALGIVRLRPLDKDKLRTALRDQLEPGQLDGIISMHLLESDASLSKPITDDPSAPNPGAGDWFLLIDGTDVKAVSATIAARLERAAIKSAVISTGLYHLMWDPQRATSRRFERHVNRVAHAALPQ